MHLHAVDYVLWLISPCLQTGVWFMMRRRGLQRTFPFFYLYTILQVISDFYLLWAAQASYALYFYSYWVVDMVSVVISFTLMNELFQQAFREYSALRDFGRLIFRWAFVVVSFAGIFVALTSNHLGGAQRLNAAVLLADRSARGMLCGLALLLLFGSLYLRISPSSVLFGIALGLALSSLTKVIVETIALAHPQPNVILVRANAFAYIAACCIWLAYVARWDRRVSPPVQVSGGIPDDGLGRNTNPLLDSINDIVERTMQAKRKS
jgi:hypothetical protein